MKLAQKYNFVDSYLAKHGNKKITSHSLNKGCFNNEIIYSLYSKDGEYMVLVDVFMELNEANQKAKDIIYNHPEMVNYLIPAGKP
ncbi:hypothetical protein [Xenorhabdus sp. PB30.3]|uniref:hypothetical protein n=1 Tax=Xenorhabdus sp. PB30.3 TaxID=2788941 RepID=UPI001E321124|nr:hypothetical protein [Xenorhabdus sp. PB30.3]MCC8382029.1 hypothetical protein [Xenorhabdus sp. PB30.3]